MARRTFRAAGKLSERVQDRSGQTDWDPVADWYDQLVGESGSEYHRHVVLPRTLKLLGLVAGERFLDVACGQGVLCRLLARSGVSCVGVDASRSLIAAARVRNEALPAGSARPDYFAADARALDRLKPLTARQFDAAACVLAIQNIQPVQPVFEGISRLLVERGRLVIVMMHPCFRSPKHTRWDFSPDQKSQTRVVERYLLPRKHPIVTHPGKDPDSYTWTFHRPLSAYIKSLVASGLLVDALEEWTSHKKSQPGPRAAAENQAREEIPMFLAIRARRVSGES